MMKIAKEQAKAQKAKVTKEIETFKRVFKQHGFTDEQIEAEIKKIMDALE